MSQISGFLRFFCTYPVNCSNDLVFYAPCNILSADIFSNGTGVGRNNKHPKYCFRPRSTSNGSSVGRSMHLVTLGRYSIFAHQEKNIFFQPSDIDIFNCQIIDNTTQCIRSWFQFDVSANLSTDAVFKFRHDGEWFIHHTPCNSIRKNTRST